MGQTLETLRGNNITSLWGRRLGLQQDETLAGAKDIKRQVQDLTSATTATAAANHGIVNAKMTTVATTAGGGAFLLSNPIPGVPVDLFSNATSAGAAFGSTAVCFQRPTSNFTIISSAGTTGVAVLLAHGTGLRLMGLTTDSYIAESLPATSAGQSAGVVITGTS